MVSRVQKSEGRGIKESENDDANLITAIKIKIRPVAAYSLFNVGELKELDQSIKRKPQGKNMLGEQASDEQLFLKREKGGRGLKSHRDTYKETRLCVTCYMANSTNRWIEVAWRR